MRGFDSKLLLFLLFCIFNSTMYSRLFTLTIIACFICLSLAKPANKRVKRDGFSINLGASSATSSAAAPIETAAPVAPSSSSAIVSSATATSSINTFAPTAAPASKSSTYYSSKFQVTFTYKDTTPLNDGAEYFSWYASAASSSKASKSSAKAASKAASKAGAEETSS